MVRDPLDTERAPDLQHVLNALDDPDCQTIVRHLDEPMTAKEIATATDIPQSTAYRKLALLSEATIVREEIKLRADGHHTTRYRVDVEEIRIRFTENRTLDLEVTRPARTPDEQLANLWTEVQKET